MVPAQVSKLVGGPQHLKETIFGENTHAEVIIGYLNDAPVSFALFP